MLRALATPSLVLLIATNPTRNPILIDRVIREKEVVNVVSSAKAGKSFLAMSIAYSVAFGRDWLGHFKTNKGRVLILDNELHDAEVAARNRAFAEKGSFIFDAGLDGSALNDRIHVMPFRERSGMPSVDKLDQFLSPLGEGDYKLIILDALYRSLPKGVSENANEDMTRVYNHLDCIAQRLGSGIIVVHHTSKGSQSGKRVTDIGSGAGAISRAPDTHMTITEHKTAGCCVLETVNRSFPKSDSCTIKFDYPEWTICEDVKPERETPRTKRDLVKAANDQRVEEALQANDEPTMSIREIQGKTGLGAGTIQSCLARLEADLRVEVHEHVPGKRRGERFGLLSSQTSA